MTVSENLAFPLKVRRMNKVQISERVVKALDMVQLGNFGDRRPAQLSGGQQQRVAVARALVFDPGLVLMDEPLGALDKQLREQMQYEIKHIHDRLGVTVVYVTHDQAEALTMSNRICVFNDGVVQQLASPEDLYERPDNAFVAQFIGENNTLMGFVMSVSGETCKVQLGNREEVQALNVNVGGIGKQTTLSLRPERVEVNPESGKYPNEFQGRIEELIYLGDHIRTRASVCGRDDFIVKIPNATRHAVLQKGDMVNLGWFIEDCRALNAVESG
jgi:putative spermidine/putrescine transport system ATP-binding protein